MREHNNIPTEDTECWDDGTYQTGATQPGKRQSGLITGLLVAVIFLGGIASAMGIMNVRLLNQLIQQENPVLPVAVDAGTMEADLFRNDPVETPEVPENARLQLQEKSMEIVDPAAVTARLTVTDHLNQEKSGTALILSEDGYLLTNAHLTDSALSITVLLPDGQTVPAALVACDPYSDLAVVYVGVQGLTPAAFSDAAGDTADTLPADSDDVVIFQDDGRVKGMLCLDMKTQMKQIIDSQQLMDIATQLVEKGCVSGRPDLGVQVRAMSHFCREYWELEHGVEIIEGRVEELLSGDILLSVNGQRITSCHQLHRLLLDAADGEEMKLEIFRAGQTFIVTLPVSTNP